MTRTSLVRTTALLLFVAFGLGCLKDESLDTNRVPDARARAVGSNGQVVDATSEGGLDALKFEFNGDPVEVTLDALASRDLDGEVVAYDWRYVAPLGDAGVPAATGFWHQAEALDPANVARPKVNLPMGAHTFTLWVTDDDGAVSAPDTITINVGADSGAACADNAAPEIDEACATCTCAVSAACAVAVPMCDADCWGLIGCIATMCPTFSMDMDTACVLTNCVAFIGGSTGAMAAGSCVMPCATECTPSITAIVTAAGG